MEMRTLGNTGLEVSRLGAGLSRIGFELRLSDVAEAGRVLNGALDDGINFLDTAACYGSSEDLIGRTIAHRRDEYALATKCGDAYVGSPGIPWTAQTIRDNIDRSLARMKTDHLDLVQLHSCNVSTLQRGEAIGVLLEAKEAGKTRFVGYSGDNEAALWAIESGQFDTLQTSFNVTDQYARIRLFGPAKSRGMGMIIKRPIANSAWGAERSPSGYASRYFQRAQAMNRQGPIPGEPEDRILAALGFVLTHPEVDTAIVGTRNPSHMMSNIEMVNQRLPIPAEVVAEMQRRFDESDDGWLQLN